VHSTVDATPSVWSRWKAGQTLHEIGRVFDKPHSCIRSVLLPRGGVPPSARRRSRLALTLAERDVSRGIASGSSIRETASRLVRAASTVSREIARHGAVPLIVPMIQIAKLGFRPCVRRESRKAIFHHQLQQQLRILAIGLLL